MDEIDALLDQAKADYVNVKHHPKQISIREEVAAIPKLQTDVQDAKVSPAKILVTNLKALPTREKPKKADTAGKDWFDMGTPEITSEIKRDLELLKMRHVFDPKRHYKRETSTPKHFAIGTIKEDSSEFFSSRIPRKERKQTLAQELLATRKDYFKSKFSAIQTKKRSGGKKHFKKLKDMRA